MMLSDDLLRISKELRFSLILTKQSIPDDVKLRLNEIATELQAAANYIKTTEENK